MKILLGSGRVKSSLSRFPKRISILVVLVFLFASIATIEVSVFLWPVAAVAQGSEKAVLHRDHPLVQEAIGVQRRHLDRLMRIPDVVGTGVGIGPDGLPVIRVFTTRPGVRGIPERLESTPVQVEVTGMVVALECPEGSTEWCDRPVPIGVSTGHPAITAGTIGARVTDGDGTFVYALSNNHVYANQNEAAIGDSALQPGPFDGGSDPEDAIGELYDFEPIDFTLSGVNYIDAAIALSTQGNLDNSTLQDGYGIPSSEIAPASIGLDVQKYGRTTGLTQGQVSAINVYVEVCYEQWWILCIKSAYFYDQIEISGSGFSGGGDSGSLIVTADGNMKPVGLLFAGSDTTTFANRIDRVLCRFSKRVDDGSADKPPVADFSYTLSGLTASFADRSTDPDVCIKTWNWDFGDGGASTLQNPTHTYGSPGTYTVALTVTDTDGASEAKTQSVTVNAAPGPPATPSNLTAQAVSRRQINLAWTDNATNEDGFKIERCQGSTCTNFKQIAIVGPSVTAYSNTGLRRNTVYRYRIRAFNAAGNSGYSNTASAKTFLY